MTFHVTTWRTADGRYEINVWRGQWSLTIAENGTRTVLPATSYDDAAHQAQSHLTRGTRELHRPSPTPPQARV